MHKHFHAENVSYSYNWEQIPAIPKADIGKHLPSIIPLAAFGWGPDCSVRGPPERGTAKRLAAELVKDRWGGAAGGGCGQRGSGIQLRNQPDACAHASICAMRVPGCRARGP